MKIGNTEIPTIIIVVAVFVIAIAILLWLSKREEAEGEPPVVPVENGTTEPGSPNYTHLEKFHLRNDGGYHAEFEFMLPEGRRYVYFNGTRDYIVERLGTLLADHRINITQYNAAITELDNAIGAGIDFGM